MKNVELNYAHVSNNYYMEIAESISWITLGFLPMLGSMEVAWKEEKILQTTH